MSAPRIHEADVCIFHDSCSDGIAAAWLFKQEFPELVAVAARHDDSKFDFQHWARLVADKHVVCVDFCFPRPLLQRLQKISRSFTVLDHHKTAQTEAGRLPYCYFDLAKSGATIAWEALYGDTLAPDLFLYVEDQDLYRWSLIDSRPLCAYINSVPRTMTDWDKLAFDFVNSRERLVAEGAAVARSRAAAAEELSVQVLEQWDVFGTRVLVVNTGTLRNEVCDYLRTLAETPVVGCYWITRGVAYWSLRTAGDSAIDVSELASRCFGGGGHHDAAGFSIPVYRMDFGRRRLA